MIHMYSVEDMMHMYSVDRSPHDRAGEYLFAVEKVIGYLVATLLRKSIHTNTRLTTSQIPAQIAQRGDRVVRELSCSPSQSEPFFIPFSRGPEVIADLHNVKVKVHVLLHIAGI